MFTEQTSYITKFGLLLMLLGLIGLLLTGCLDISSLFRAGCVDVSFVIKVDDTEGGGRSMLTVSTDSEEAFEVIKSSLEEEDNGSDEEEQVETTINEEEGLYSVMYQYPLSEDDFQIETEGPSVVYTIEGIVLDLGGLIEEENSDEVIGSCDGYYYSFTLDLPNKIQQAWWINSEKEKIEEVGADKLDNRSFSFQIPMSTVLSKAQPEEWADRSGVIIQAVK